MDGNRFYITVRYCRNDTVMLIPFGYTFTSRISLNCTTLRTGEAPISNARRQIASAFGPNCIRAIAVRIVFGEHIYHTGNTRHRTHIYGELAQFAILKDYRPAGKVQFLDIFFCRSLHCDNEFVPQGNGRCAEPDINGARIG